MIAVFLCVLPSGLSLRVEDQRGAAERVGRLYFLGLDSWCPGVLAVRFISDWLCLLLSHWAGTGRRVRMVVMAPFARFVWLSPGASSDSARGESPLGRNEARARTSVQLMERRGPPRRCNAGGIEAARLASRGSCDSLFRQAVGRDNQTSFNPGGRSGARFAASSWVAWGLRMKNNNHLGPLPGIPGEGERGE
jgi:hypothetical protein